MDFISCVFLYFLKIFLFSQLSGFDGKYYFMKLASWPHLFLLQFCETKIISQVLWDKIWNQNNDLSILSHLLCSNPVICVGISHALIPDWQMLFDCVIFMSAFRNLFFPRVLVLLYLGLTVPASEYSLSESYCKCIFLHNEWNLITSSHCNLVVLCVWLVCCSVFISCRGLHYVLLCSVFLYCSLLTWLLLIWRFIILTPLVEFPYFVGVPPPPSLVLQLFFWKTPT